MGDDGEEYSAYTEELCEKDADSCAGGRLWITRMVTWKHFLLLYGSRGMHTEWQKLPDLSTEALLEYIQQTGRLLTENFRAETVITGISHESEDGQKCISSRSVRKTVRPG